VQRVLAFPFLTQNPRAKTNHLDLQQTDDSSRLSSQSFPETLLLFEPEAASADCWQQMLSWLGPISTHLWSCAGSHNRLRLLPPFEWSIDEQPRDSGALSPQSASTYNNCTKKYAEDMTGESDVKIISATELPHPDHNLSLFPSLAWNARRKMKCLAITIIFLLLLCGDGLAQQTSDIHQHTTPPAGARFEIVQSELAAKWTFRLDRFTGHVAQLVKTDDDDNTWAEMTVLNLPPVKAPLHPRFQLFVSGLAAKFTFLIDTETGTTWC
jgi:hypothetical protein